MSAQAEPIIKIWSYSQAPQHLKRVSAVNSEWVALIPPGLVRPEVEILFLRWNTDSHPIIRHTLADGSVLFAGYSVVGEHR
jgi:hypothetical protein